jgi:putative Holliday junction resolvase
MRIMAIDYGDAHTGVAVSDPTGFLTGFTTVIDAYRPEAVAERIAALAAEHGAEELVLGHPINMVRHPGPRSERPTP